MSTFLYPKVTYHLNQDLDEEMAFCFLGTEAGGIYFNDSVLKPNPRLALALDSLMVKSPENIKSEIGKYFDKFYRLNSAELENSVKKADSDWRRAEERFFREVATIFGGHRFPKGDYEAYISIIDCNPRFLQNKTFQIFYKHMAGPVYITCHELLHFIFYDYVADNCPKLRGLDPDNGKLWDMAEIFNSVILATPEFVEIHGYKDLGCYPAHKRFVEEMSVEWGSDKNLARFIDKISGKL